MTPQHGDDSRARILAAAAAVAAEYGYDGTTIARVTAASGLPASSLYWFFADKDELLAEVVTHSFRAWLLEQSPWERPAPGVTWQEALRAVLSPNLASLVTRPDFIVIGYLLTLREVDCTGRSRYLQLRARTVEVIGGWFAERLAEMGTTLAPMLAEQLGQLLMVWSDGLVMADRLGAAPDIDWLLETMIATVEAAVQEA